MHQGCHSKKHSLWPPSSVAELSTYKHRGKCCLIFFRLPDVLELLETLLSILPLSFYLYSTTHLLQIYSWPSVFEDHLYSIQVRFLMPPMSEKLHTVLPLLIPREGSAAAQSNPCAHNSSPYYWWAASLLEQPLSYPSWGTCPRGTHPAATSHGKSCRAQQAAETSPPPLGITAFMCSWRVNSSLKIKILGTVTIWNCKITLDLFPLQFFFLFSKIMGNSVCHAARLPSSTRAWQFSPSVKAWCSMASTLTHSIATSHGFAHGLQSKGRAVTHLQKTFKQQLIILNWESLLWGQHCPSPGQSVAGRLWLTLESRGFSAQLSFLQEMNPCKIPLPFCVLFKASLLTLLHSVFSDPLHPTEGFRSQIFRAKGWAKQSQTPKGRVRMCFAREQQCSETMFSIGSQELLSISLLQSPFVPMVSRDGHLGFGGGTG